MSNEEQEEAAVKIQAAARAKAARVVTSKRAAHRERQQNLPEEVNTP